VDGAAGCHIQNLRFCPFLNSLRAHGAERCEGPGSQGAGCAFSEGPCNSCDSPKKRSLRFAEQLRETETRRATVGEAEQDGTQGGGLVRKQCLGDEDTEQNGGVEMVQWRASQLIHESRNAERRSSQSVSLRRQSVAVLPYQNWHGIARKSIV
jgi:hypothetical protein